jgi:hypothetical protein
MRIGDASIPRTTTLEPVDGVFDFSHVDRVIQAMNEIGISVIVGTSMDA